MADSQTQETLPWLIEKEAKAEVKGKFEDALENPKEALTNAAQIDGHLHYDETGVPEKKTMPQLDPTWFASQLFWLVICFVVLYVFMVRTIIPRIREVLESRQHRIEADLEYARTMQEEAEAVKEEYELSMEASRTQVRALIHKAQEETESAAAERHKVLDKEVADMNEAAEAAIRAELKETEKELKPIAQDLASMVVEKILLTKADEKSVEAAVKDQMKQHALVTA